jgi:mannose-1-phosphate guanylyltransferase
MEAIVLAGGSGTRFWPLSRRRRPKQLLALDSEQSLLRTTVSRQAPFVEPSSVWVCTTRDLAAAVREELPEVPPEQILEEPAGRNTSAAIGWTIQSMPAELRAGAVAVLPADHRIGGVVAFRGALEMAEEICLQSDRVVTLGIEPRWPETGYGYLELGRRLDSEGQLHEVVRFTEKPDEETARRFVESGDYLWNAGIFIFRGERMLELLGRFQPEIAAGLDKIGREPDRLEEIYPQLPSISIDFAVMEKIDDLVTIPIECDWSDLGSWAALWDVLEGDEAGNVTRGRVLTIDCNDNLIFAEEGSVAALGVSDMVIVRTGDTVLVVPRRWAQEVRRLVSQLEERGLDELL